MTEIKATRRRPGGFRDVDDYKSVVTIIGFVWGKSHDVGGYSDNRQECAIAICVNEHGDMESVPIANLTIGAPDMAKDTQDEH